MRKLLLLLTLLLSISTYVAAQNYTEVVYLKNGSIIKGVIIEQVPNVSLKIKTSDGSLIICQMSDVEKITKEERYTRDYRKEANNRKAARNTLKGYKGFVDFAYIGDVSDYNASKIELSTSHGYHINSIIISSLVVVLLSTTIQMQILLLRQSMLTSGLTSSTKE